MSILEWFGLGPKARAYLVAHGEVYEGGYNLFVERMARQRGLRGWMKVVQQPMNSYIQAEVEGSKSGIEKYLLDLQKGSGRSKIKNIEVEWRPYKGNFIDFRQRT